MKYFTQDYESIEDLKKHFRLLIKQYHPDHGGDEEITKIIISEYEKCLSDFVSSCFSNKKKENEDFSFNDDDIYKHTEILKKIIHLDDIEIEIIGTWIYVWNSFTVKDYLKSLDFWFSAKHKAWIYSGGKKRKFYSKQTLGDIRDKYGSQKVKKEETEKIAI